eukprot:CAMPEP_0201502788 /NCGR_PEP_ID=MMETSP0151_2-20130828/84322_1 /ASSEMBLY_ACC=CAM_ASM_000257 /TAXON_ID=200890 /ORGANISM="Paramoeba atlantica, Strain 621/1 / CCAP 1560/9" /LENGTH=353 /DNA_ID=CAMNT_0047896411 /DNA_START=165 /DNA_END=1226 /DNA_ORIENTATION=-
MKIDREDIQKQLRRRRPGQSSLTTSRNEADECEILSGTENGLTLGTPISILVRNKDHRPQDYKEMSKVPRPSHADYTYMAKYGINASSGGGRASARETIGRVAAGALAEKWLFEKFGVRIVAFVESIGPISIGDAVSKKSEEEEGFSEEGLTREMVDSTPVRCPVDEVAKQMGDYVLKLKEENDSTGGVIRCVVSGVPVGWGEPCFEKLEALLAHAMLSIPSTKGFEIGSGFAGTTMRGSQHNDPFVKKEGGKLGTVTNNSGGIQGGISNGETIRFGVAFKPPATIALAQNTSSYSGEPGVLESRGRHDPCVCPRAVPIVEGMCAMVLADVALKQIAQQHASEDYPKIFDLLL